MTTPAVTIQDAIDFCANNISELAWDGVVSIKTRMNTWVAAIFGDAGAFPPNNNQNETQNINNQRWVTNWRGLTNTANRSIEGPAPGDAGLVGVSNVIDAVFRTLCAVRDATAAGATTGAQQTLTIAAFNAAWT